LISAAKRATLREGMGGRRILSTSESSQLPTRPISVAIAHTVTDGNKVHDLSRHTATARAAWAEENVNNRIIDVPVSRRTVTAVTRTASGAFDVGALTSIQRSPSPTGPPTLPPTLSSRSSGPFPSFYVYTRKSYNIRALKAREQMHLLGCLKAAGFLPLKLESRCICSTV
jgi:hypothetical protein